MRISLFETFIVFALAQWDPQNDSRVTFFIMAPDYLKASGHILKEEQIQFYCCRCSLFIVLWARCELATINCPKPDRQGGPRSLSSPPWRSGLRTLKRQSLLLLLVHPEKYRSEHEASAQVISR